MKFALVFAALLAVSAAQPPAAIFSSPNRLPATRRPPIYKPFPSNLVAGSDQAAKIIRYDNEANPDGSYRYNVLIDNGITAQAQGTPRDFGGNPPVAPIVSKGSFSWTSPEGELIVITYVADENGYRPSSDASGTLSEFLPPASDIGKSIKDALQNSQNRRA